MIADRDVLVPEVARGDRHLLDRGLAVGPRRVAVQVAADVSDLDEVGRRAPKRGLAQLRRAPRNSEPRIQALFGLRLGQQAEGRDVLRGSRRAYELGPEALGWGHDELDRCALHGDADRVPLVPLDDRHDGRKTLERVDHPHGILRAADDREIAHDVAPPPHVSGDLAAELVGDRGRRRTCAIDEQAATPRPVCPEAGEDLPLGLGPDARSLLEPPSGSCRAKLVGGPNPERPPERHHSLRAETDQVPERDELWLHRALELIELHDAAGGDELVKARLDRRADAAQLAHPAVAHELCHGGRGLAHEVRRAPVGAHGVVPRAREVEQSGVCLEGLGDLVVVHVGSLFPCRQSSFLSLEWWARHAFTRLRAHGARWRSRCSATCSLRRSQSGRHAW